MDTATKSNRKYQLYASEGGPAEVIATFDVQREARRYLTSTASRMGMRRLKQDMWSNGKSLMFIKTYWPGAKHEL